MLLSTAAVLFLFFFSSFSYAVFTNPLVIPLSSWLCSAPPLLRSQILVWLYFCRRERALLFFFLTSTTFGLFSFSARRFIISSRRPFDTTFQMRRIISFLSSRLFYRFFLSRQIIQGFHECSLSPPRFLVCRIGRPC